MTMTQLAMIRSLGSGPEMQSVSSTQIPIQSVISRSFVERREIKYDRILKKKKDAEN